MKDFIKNIKKLNYPMFFVEDSQEWEVQDDDFDDNEYVEYSILNNLIGEQYILIEKVLQQDYEFMLQDRIAKIQAINEQYDLENNAYISFSGGKDSVVMSHLIDLALPGNNIPRVYVDTGIDYTLMRNFVLDLKQKDNRVIIIQPKMNIRKTLEEYGYPFKSKDFAAKVYIYQRHGLLKGLKRFLEFDGILKCPNKLKYLFENQNAVDFKISDKCCLKMKEEPLDNWGKEHNKTITIIGICKDEGGRRDIVIKGCLSQRKDVLKFYPLKVVDKDWEDQFIKDKNVQLCELYYPPYNFKRTGCKGCPFDKYIEKDLKILEKYFPLERKQCEHIWKPVYDEYRKINYRLKKEEE